MARPLSPKQTWEIANPIWAQSLNPVLANRLNSCQFVTYSLIIGVNTINHGLGRMMTGWFIADINAAATIYRSAPLNDQTLTLTSNAAARVVLGVF